MRNHGNYVASLSQLGRWLAEEAEALGVTVLPETSAEKLLVVARPRASACARATAAAAATASRSRASSRAPTSPRSVTVLAEGTQGTSRARRSSASACTASNPQVWALGVKEVWRVAKPLRKVIHTMGWPLRGGKRYREFGGSFIYPMGDDIVSLGMVVGLDYRDVSSCPCTTCCRS